LVARVQENDGESEPEPPEARRKGHEVQEVKEVKETCAWRESCMEEKRRRNRGTPKLARIRMEFISGPATLADPPDSISARASVQRSQTVG